MIYLAGGVILGCTMAFVLGGLAAFHSVIYGWLPLRSLHIIEHWAHKHIQKRAESS